MKFKNVENYFWTFIQILSSLWEALKFKFKYLKKLSKNLYRMFFQMTKTCLGLIYEVFQFSGHTSHMCLEVAHYFYSRRHLKIFFLFFKTFFSPMKVKINFVNLFWCGMKILLLRASCSTWKICFFLAPTGCWPS